MDDQLPDFTGQTVVFYITTSSESLMWVADGIAMDSPSFHRQGDRVFVTGKTPPADDNSEVFDREANRDIGLAWDSVFYYVVAPTKEYREAIRKEGIAEG